MVWTLTAAPTSSNSAEVDFLSDPYSLNSLAIVPTTTATATSESGAFTNSGSGNGFPLESTASNQVGFMLLILATF